MGATLSTILMLGGSLASGVLSAMAARQARDGNWSKVRLYAGICIAMGILLAMISLFLVIKSRSSAAVVTSGLEEMALGVMISFVLMMLATVAMTILDIMALVRASDQNKKSAEDYAIGASITSFGSFVLSLIIIIFLL